MAIDKLGLFENTKALWPKTINLSAPDATHNIYWKNERSISADDAWQQVAMWAFHQSLGELERKAVAEGASAISPHGLEFATFDKWMRFNLEGDDSWAAEQNEWEAAN